MKIKFDSKWLAVLKINFPYQLRTVLLPEELQVGLKKKSNKK